jgi:hypothetical protein
MKKLLILMLVLGVASVANATLLLSVDGVTDPPETEVTLHPSDEAVIDVMGDGRAQPQAAYLIVQGPGTIAGHTMLYGGTLVTYQDLEEIAVELEMTPEDVLAVLAEYGYDEATDLSYMNFADAPGGDWPTLDGKLVDDIIFHCEGPLMEPLDVTLTLTDGDFAEVFDVQIIHQVPEPMTLTLLGLGGLLLRRRK